MSGGVPIALPASLVQGFGYLRSQSYLDAAATTLLAWDLILTLPEEVELMWPSSWNGVKVLFYLSRYLPFVDMCLVLYAKTTPFIDARTCQLTYYPSGWINYFGIVIAEVVLVVRTWAIWSRSKVILTMVILASIAALAPTIFIESVFLKSLVFSPFPHPATPGCLVTKGSQLIGFNLVVCIIFETFLLVLTLIKGVQQYKIARHTSNVQSNRLLTVLYRDGLLFYIYAFHISLLNLIVLMTAPRALADLVVTIQYALHSALTGRVLLNLRKAGRRTEGSANVSEIEMSNNNNNSNSNSSSGHVVVIGAGNGNSTGALRSIGNMSFSHPGGSAGGSDDGVNEFEFEVGGGRYLEREKMVSLQRLMFPRPNSGFPESDEDVSNGEMGMGMGRSRSLGGIRVEKKVERRVDGPGEEWIIE